MNQITTQNPWQSPCWWILIISQAAVLALTNCIEQGLGDTAVFQVVVNTLVGIQMFLSCNNTGLKGTMMLPPGQEILTVKDLPVLKAQEVCVAMEPDSSDETEA